MTTVRSARVLLVEDDQGLRANFADWLTATGHLVTQAGDGEEAIALAKAGAFDVVVTDLKMPGIDGLGLLRWFKSSSTSVPIIFLSGDAGVHDAIQALREYGAFDFLVKPLEDLWILNRAIERALSTKVVSIAPRAESPSPASTGNPLVAQVLDTIRARFREPIGLAEISDLLGYAPTYLTTLMQRETGRTVQQWVIHERLALSKLLLADTDWSLTRIADEVGYSNQTHFGRQFKQSVGETPSAWREANSTVRSALAGSSES